jgi:hypothetical protein
MKSSNEQHEKSSSMRGAIVQEKQHEKNGNVKNTTKEK